MKRAAVFWQNVKIVGGLAPRPRRWPQLLRMSVAYLRVALLDQRPFRFFDVALDYRCNLSCEHCSALPMMRRDTPCLSHEEYARFADEAMGYGAMSFHFTGGEPLLRKDLFEIIRIFKPSWNMLSVQTNGMLLTEGMVKKLVDAGIQMVCVSLDSADPSEHDRFRNRNGCFDAALAGLDRAIASGLACAVVMCVSHQNLRSEGVRALIDLVAERGVRGFISLAVPIGHWAGREEVMITPEDRVYLNELIDQYPFLRTDFESNWRDLGCPAMKEKAYLSPYGDILPCPFIQVSCGNIRTEPLKAILDRGKAMPDYAEYHPRCLAAEDRDFVRSHRCYQIGCGQVPVPADEARVTVAVRSSACSRCESRETLAPCQTP